MIRAETTRAIGITASLLLKFPDSVLIYEDCFRDGFRGDLDGFTDFNGEDGEQLVIGAI